MTTEYFSLAGGNFSQDWSDPGLFTVNDSWAGVASITGYRGDDLTAATGTDPQTLTAASTSGGVIDINFNETTPNSFTSGGVTRFSGANVGNNSVVALAGSGTADAPSLVFFVDATGRSNISFSAVLRDLESGNDNAVQQIALQYRVGPASAWTNISYIADATAGPGIAGPGVALIGTLGIDANNQAQVEIRVLSTNAPGNDEWVGIDDIVISSSAATSTTVGINDVVITEGDSGTKTATFTVTRSDNSGTFSLDFATADGVAVAGSDYVAASGTLDFTADGALTQTINVTINGDTIVEGNESFTIGLSNLVNTLGTAAFNDTSGTGTITNDDFSLVAIHTIQGASHTSPLLGLTVTTTGIVTAVAGNGFYLQTPDADIDADIATSEAIFVFTGAAAAVAVGDAANVTGIVGEFTPGGASSGNLSTTQIASPMITVLSSNNALPTAIVLGIGGRMAPTEVIDNDNFSSFDPTTDGIDFYESLEAMRVTVPAPLVVAPTNAFGEIYTVANNGMNATGLSPRGTIVTKGSVGDGLGVQNVGAGADYNPERIQIDDGLLPGATPGVGAGTVLNDVTGVVSYGFGNFEVLATAPVTVATPSILTRDVTTLVGNRDTLTIASFNAENLDPGDAAAGRFVSLATQIKLNLGSPDIIALQEIQDNSGPTNDGTIAANVTLQMLVDAISTAGGPTYSFIDNPFITNNTNGGEPGGNIRVAFLYNEARVSLVEGSVTTTPSAAAAFGGSRPPLSTTFEFNGEQLVVVNNHFTAKGGSGALFGANQPPTNSGAGARLTQAQNVADYVTSLGADAKVVVLGDLNEFTNEESLAPLGAAGLNALSLTLAQNERYSFIFEGNAQQLDQAYVSGNLLAASALDIVHTNSEFLRTAASASDHDPSVIAINLPAPLVETQLVGFQLLTVSQAEGNAGTTDFIFIVQRAGGTTGQVDFGGIFVAGTTNAADFGGALPTGFSGSILAGQTSATVTITVNGDAMVESDESFTLTLTSAVNNAAVATSIAAGSAVATGTITNDDVAPAAFGPGDVAFVGFNADGDDNLALVALKALPSGTVLYFSDNEWNGTGWADFNESSFALTLTANVAAGGIIAIDKIGSALSTTSNVGTIASVTGGGTNRGIAGSGEQVYVYIANAASPLVPTAFLAAISNDGFTALGTLDNTGLTVGQTAIDLAIVDAGADIGAFNGARSSAASFAAYLPIINNPTNWGTQDASGDQSADLIFPDVPFSFTAFSLAAANQTLAFVAASQNIALAERNSGSRDFTFAVERLGGTDGTVNFAGTIAVGTTDAADFGGTLPTIFAGNIAAGANTGTFTVSVSGDTTIESSESFVLTLTSGTNSNGSGVLINAAAAAATATIVNDDFPLAIGGINVFNAAASLAGSVTTPVANDDIVLVRLGSISGATAGAESIAYENGKAYATNIAGNAINVHRVTAAGALVNESPIQLSGLPSYRPGGVNSVDVKNGVIAVAYENIDPALGGFVALFNAADNTLIKTIQVGVLPDDVTFTPNGTKLLVANEGEALAAQGSISIIDLSGGAAAATVINTISFASLNGTEAALRDRGLAIFSGQPAANDIEPEHITVSADGTRAYVTLQEVNGVAVIDLTDPTADRPLSIQPLGTIDRNLVGNALDTSDRDGPGGTAAINIRNINIQSLLQPDAIAAFEIAGVKYFVTANEGDARENIGDTVRLGSASYVLDPTLFPNAAALKLDANLGRLNVLTNIGDTDGDGDIDVIHTLGGRGISIFRHEADGSITKVRETGGEFEAITAQLVPGSFNSNQSVAASSRDARSDDKGPEPEGVAIGVINGRTYAFVGLERVGGYMVYDVTDPANARFVTYKPQTAADLGPETSVFVAAADSPTGEALLLSANEVSNTVTLYSIQTQSNGDDVINGGGDGESFNGRGGNDIINGNGGNDIISGGAGNDRLDGGDGIDTVSYADADAGVIVRMLPWRQDTRGAGFDTLFNFENLLGSRFDDVLTGDTGANRIDGGAGNDALYGARGNDTLVGGLGNDFLQGGVDGDTFVFDVVGNGDVDVITDFSFAAGDTLVFGPGVTVTGVQVGFLTTDQLFNGLDVRNSARSLDVVLTLSSNEGTQTLHVVDAYGFGSNGAWESLLGIDLTYPRPLPSGMELVHIA